MNKSVFIYQIQDPKDNSIFYVGKTCNVIVRFSDHSNIKFNESTNPLVKRLTEINNSSQRLVFTIIEECENDELAKEREFYWIDKLLNEGNDLLNVRKRKACKRFDIRFANGVNEREFKWSLI